MYSAPTCVYNVVGNHIETDKTVKGKITGTMMGAILGLSPFTTPFQAACEALGLGREDISSKPAVIRGKALEAKIIRYAGTKWADYGTWLDADEVFNNRGDNPHAAPSDFEDDVFAGHCDGILMTPDGQEYIVEVKTSINYDSWSEGVPVYYYWQTAIYDHFLTHKDKVYFVLGLANENTDRDPYSWIANEETVFKFDTELNHQDVEDKILQIREWYARYIVNGITPDYDPTNKGDVALYNHLVALSSSDVQRSQIISRIQELTNKINTAKVDADIIGMEAELRDLKDQVKDLMVTLELTDIPSEDGEFGAKLTAKTDFKFDETLMVQDNVDPRKYKKEVTTYTLRTNPIKKKQ